MSVEDFEYVRQSLGSVVEQMDKLIEHRKLATIIPCAAKKKKKSARVKKSAPIPAPAPLAIDIALPDGKTTCCAISVPDLAGVKPDGKLYYIESYKQFAFMLAGKIFRGNLGRVLQKDATPENVKACKYVSCVKREKCSYYHDPAKYQGSADVRNYPNVRRAMDAGELENYIMHNIIDALKY